MKEIISHSGFGWSYDFVQLSPICLSFVSRLSSTLGLVGCMIFFTCLHLSVFCLSLGSHSGSCWSHDFLHLSSIGLSFVMCLPLVFTLVPVGRMTSFTCFPFVFHLSPACLPLSVWLVAYKWETSEGNHATNRTQSGRQMKDKGETSDGNHATNRPNERQGKK